MSRRKVALAAPNATAVQAGLAQAAAGGNAVDVAIAAIVAGSVTEPGIVSPMGGAFVNVWVPGQEPVVIDGNVEMPGRGASAAMFGAGLERIDMAYGGGITIHGGHGSVATPGMFAALADASLRWGLLPWPTLLEPSVAALREGYPLSASAAYYLTFSGTSLFAWHPQTRDWLAQGGDDPVPLAGQVMRSPDLAGTLELIGRDGARTLYDGELAEIIAADMSANGGLITRADLAAYRTAARTPLRSTLGAWDVAVNPGPSIGGPVLTTMLRLLASRWAEHGASPDDVIAVQRLVLQYRHKHIDAAADLAAAGAELIRIVTDSGPEGLAALCSSPDTIHVSAVDADGLACSITTSAGYGSGVTTPGTGLMLNNALGEPELNRRGLHALPPGTRLASNMAPTTARTRHGDALAIGSPGADRITTALMQVLSATCLGEADLQSAIDAPRLHVAVDGEGRATVIHEEGPGLNQAARDSGLPSTTYEELSMYFGGVGAGLRRADGTLTAHGDPRREAATGVA